MTHKINHADIKEWAANYDGEPFDAILCDPPYELGFMGKSWDSTGIAFDTDLWKDLLRICKPGAHLLAFSGSRTYHRMAVAIEDAGFEIRDQLIWMYGSGFPKSLNIGKAVDKLQGNEREWVSKSPFQASEEAEKRSEGKCQSGRTTHPDITKGTSEWEGYGTALKPAHEPCVLARKPLDGTVANNVLKHGTGGLNIDGSRVGITGGETHRGGFQKQYVGDKVDYENHGVKTDLTPRGRFPANLIHDGSDEVEAVFPQTKSGDIKPHHHKSNVYGGNALLSSKTINSSVATYGDSGSASRFFYCAKASKSERNAGLEGFEDAERTDYGGFHSEKGLIENGRNPENRVPMKNGHPTVKPLSLTKYLATLIKPPTGGRLLVPFSGSGSEMIGALQAGWEYVEGVELTEEYIPIAEARIKYWTERVKEEDKQVRLV